MPIDVFWEDFDWAADTSGPVPTRVLKVVRDDHSLVTRFLTALQHDEFPHLSFISHETVTVFHQRSLGPLVGELEALRKREQDPAVLKQIGAVLELVAGARGPTESLIAFRVRKGEDAA